MVLYRFFYQHQRFDFLDWPEFKPQVRINTIDSIIRFVKKRLVKQLASVSMQSLGFVISALIEPDQGFATFLKLEQLAVPWSGFFLTFSRWFVRPEV